MDKKDYYSILGIDKSASKEQIHKAFLKMSKKYHPDMQNGKSDAEKKEAEEKMKLVNEANDVLNDDNKRAYYDRFGTIDPAASQQANGFHGFGNMDDIMRHMHSHFHQGFGFGDFGFGGGGSNEQPEPDFTSPRNGRNTQINVKFSFMDAFCGVKKEFDISFEEICEHCHGNGAGRENLEKCSECNGSGMKFIQRGMMMSGTTCSRCNGSGYTVKKPCEHCHGTGHHKVSHHLNINLPQGMDTGDKLRVANEGEHGLCGGSNGSLFINCEIEPSPIYEREGTTLYTKLFISPLTAALGGKVSLKTLYGEIELNIPKNTTNGKKFRIPQNGITRGGVTGDLIVIIEIETISNLTKEQTELIEKLSKSLNDNNFPLKNEMEQKITMMVNDLKNRK